MREMIAECMELAPDDLPADDEDLIDYGLHSIGIMQFASACQQHGVEIQSPELSRTPSIRDWWHLLSARQRGPSA
jgi:aryl carrier-like protein